MFAYQMLYCISLIFGYTNMKFDLKFAHETESSNKLIFNIKMKKLNLIVMAIFCIAFVSVGLTSCEELENALADPNDLKSVNVEYSLKLCQTWYDYYDIRVTYYDEKGDPHTVTVTDSWEYSFSVRPKDAPGNYVFNVLAVPKKEHPEFDQLQYILSEDIEGHFYGIKYDGSIFNSYGLYKSDRIEDSIFTMNPDQFERYFKGGQRNLMNFTNSFKASYIN